MERNFSMLTPTFQHIAGMDNTRADGLSRLPMTDETSFEVTNSIFANQYPRQRQQLRVSS
jgi:hypothetical protein